MILNNIGDEKVALICLVSIWLYNSRLKYSLLILIQSSLNLQLKENNFKNTLKINSYESYKSDFQDSC